MSLRGVQFVVLACKLHQRITELLDIQKCLAIIDQHLYQLPFNQRLLLQSNSSTNWNFMLSLVDCHFFVDGPYLFAYLNCVSIEWNGLKPEIMFRIVWLMFKTESLPHPQLMFPILILISIVGKEKNCGSNGKRCQGYSIESSKTYALDMSWMANIVLKSKHHHSFFVYYVFVIPFGSFIIILRDINV